MSLIATEGRLCFFLPSMYVKSLNYYLQKSIGFWRKNGTRFVCLSVCVSVCPCHFLAHGSDHIFRGHFGTFCLYISIKRQFGIKKMLKNSLKCFFLLIYKHKMSFWHQKMFKNDQKVSLWASIQAKNEFRVLKNPPQSHLGLVYTSKRSSGCLKRFGNS